MKPIRPSLATVANLKQQPVCPAPNKGKRLLGAAMILGFLVIGIVIYRLPSAQHTAPPQHEESLIPPLAASAQTQLPAPTYRIEPPAPLPQEEPEDPRFHRPTSRDRWLAEWAAKDFQAARAWATQQAQPLKDWALGNLHSLLSKTDPAGALRLCLESGFDQRQPLITSNVFQSYAAASPEAAYAWATSLPEGTLREYCAPRLFTEMALHAPDLAGNIVLNTAASEDGVGPKFVSMIERWCEIRPESAAAWLQAKTTAPWQLDALEVLVAKWSPWGHEAVATWIEKMPAGPERERTQKAFELYRPRAPAAPEEP